MCWARATLPIGSLYDLPVSLWLADPSLSAGEVRLIPSPGHFYSGRSTGVPATLYRLKRQYIDYYHSGDASRRRPDASQMGNLPHWVVTPYAAISHYKGTSGRRPGVV